MTFGMNDLHDLKMLHTPLLVSLNGFKVQVIQYGKLRLTELIEVENVLVVPHFKFNLLSIKKLSKQLHCKVVFTEDICLL